jgi:hypothetical protein
MKYFMGELIKIKKSTVQKIEPCVTISKNQISFNAIMRNMAELEKNQYVNIYSDDEDKRIAFEFKPVKDSEDDFKIRTTAKYPNLKCHELFKKDWVAKVSTMRGQNIFEARQEKGKWVITLSALLSES